MYEQNNMMNSIKRIIDETCKNLPNDIADTGKFNIFKILGIESKEVLICRFLGELLKPNGSHNMGTIPLELFIKNVLEVKDETNSDLETASIDLEEHVDRSDGSEGGKRRADIVIHTKNRVYPIEVKINAGDQPAQLHDYYKHFFKDNKGIIYYLTPTGYEPSKDSMGDLLPRNIKLISFIKFEPDNKHIPSIENWINDVIQECRNNDAKSTIESTIQQFLEVVQEMRNNDSKAVKCLEDLVSFEEIDEERKNNISALSLICRNAETILKNMQQKYVRKYVQLGNDFEFRSVDYKPKRYKDHIIISIYSKINNRLVAWLAEDNVGLYLISNSNKKPNANGWDIDQGDIFWKRVLTSKDNKIKMDKLTPITDKDEIIDISNSLSEIVNELQSKESSIPD